MTTRTKPDWLPHTSQAAWDTLEDARAQYDEALAHARRGSSGGPLTKRLATARLEQARERFLAAGRAVGLDETLRSLKEGAK